jgi:hypothetical protein
VGAQKRNGGQKKGEVREKIGRKSGKSKGIKGEGRIGFADEGAKRKVPLYESVFLFRHVDNTCPAILEKCTCLFQ